MSSRERGKVEGRLRAATCNADETVTIYMMNERHRGKIKHWTDRGFGFAEFGVGKSIFVHVRDVANQQELSLGDTITFTVGTARDGRTLAQDVKLEDESAPEFISR